MGLRTGGLVTEVADKPHPEWGAGTAVFSADRVYRYALARRWNPDLPMTAFVMLNPSTADAFVVDPTVRRCLGFARDWGSGGLLVLNAFALRSTDPRGIYRSFDGAHGGVPPCGPLNDEVILAMLEACQPAQVVAGWGHHAGAVNRAGRRKPRGLESASWRSRHAEMVDLLGDRLLALKTTQAGFPGHPLYLGAETRPEPFTGRALDPLRP
jgi:hypothetical protein